MSVASVADGGAGGEPYTGADGLNATKFEFRGKLNQYLQLLRGLNVLISCGCGIRQRTVRGEINLRAVLCPHRSNGNTFVNFGSCGQVLADRLIDNLCDRWGIGDQAQSISDNFGVLLQLSS